MGVIAHARRRVGREAVHGQFEARAFMRNAKVDVLLRVHIIHGETVIEAGLLVVRETVHIGRGVGHVGQWR